MPRTLVYDDDIRQARKPRAHLRQRNPAGANCCEGKQNAFSSEEVATAGPSAAGVAA